MNKIIIYMMHGIPVFGSGLDEEYQKCVLLPADLVAETQSEEELWKLKEKGIEIQAKELSDVYRDTKYKKKYRYHWIKGIFPCPEDKIIVQYRYYVRGDR